MNELRMYVERLFEGRVLTQENIELKEEIYGNLIARYEDYLAEGLSETDALARTKASMPSINDVIADASVQNAMPHSSELPADSAESDAMVTAPSLGAVSAPDSGQAEGVHAGEGPVRPAEMGDANGLDSKEGATKSSWIKTPRNAALVGFAVIVLALFGFWALTEAIWDHGDDVAEDIIENVVKSSTSGNNSTKANQGTNTAGGSTTSPSTNGTAQGGTQTLPTGPTKDSVYVDASGSVWVDAKPADELAMSVVQASPDAVAQFAGSSATDTKAISGLVAALPMGQWVQTATPSSTGALTIEYRAVPHYYDGDSIELALAYNVAAMFCALPDATSIQVSLSESDEPYDMDYYIFDRQQLETQFGWKLEQSAITADGWTKLKDQGLYTSHFVDRAVEIADRG